LGRCPLHKKYVAILNLTKIAIHNINNYNPYLKKLHNLLEEQMTTLSKRIREETKKSHTMVENTGFITCFLKGVVETKSYTKLMSDLYHVYTTMEEQFVKYKEHSIISKVYYPELFRKESIENDLKYYLGSNWKEQLTQTDSCKSYVNRIKIISPYLLIAHQYTRYIGDLSGGQVLKGIAQTALGVDDNAMNFYIFKDIPNEKEFKNKYRNTLDLLPLEQDHIDKIIEEANYAFKLNMNIFKEVEGNLISTIGRVLFSTLTSKKRRGSTEND
jgi:heme oxygenase (biliverdin-producing, ferredoxin)